jgi:hypothetical protein
MKQEVIQKTVERGGNFTEKAFTIKADAKMFNLLSDKIYADKTGAVIRELASNAKDAHTVAGKENIPFDIHVPNEMYPHFSVRDYGKGLTHTEMFDIYTTYSESTKNSSNREIGAFGVGAKSPFAYTDNFTIVSRIEQFKRTYTAYIGEEGIPVLALINEEPNDEPSGLEVIVPIKQYDFNVFQLKVFSVLQYFTPLPNIKGLAPERVAFDSHEYLIRGTNWGLRTKRFGGPRVIQGGVFYPVNFNSVYKQDIPDCVSSLINSPIDFYFDMFDDNNERGNLDVALSREALSYDAYTCEQLKKTLVSTQNEIVDKMVKDLDALPTFWEACKQFTALFRSFGSILPHNLKWKNGKALDVQFNFKQSLTITTHITIKVFANRRGHRTGKYLSNEVRGEYSNSHFFLNNSSKGAGIRIKEHAKKQPGELYLISLDSNSDEAKRAYDELIDLLGNPPIKNVDELPLPVVTQTTKVRVVNQPGTINCYQRNGRMRVTKRDMWNSVSVDIKDGGYYVELDRFGVAIKDSGSTANIDDLVQLMSRLNLIKPNITVYGVGPRVLKQLKKEKHWVNLVELAQRSCEDPSAKKMIYTKMVYDQLRAQSLPLLKLFLRLGLVEKQKSFKQFSVDIKDENVKEFFTSLSQEHQYNYDTISYWSRLGNTVQAKTDSKENIYKVGKSKVDFYQKLWDNIIIKYPILKYLDFEQMINENFDNDFIQFINGD